MPLWDYLLPPCEWPVMKLWQNRTAIKKSHNNKNVYGSKFYLGLYLGTKKAAN